MSRPFDVVASSGSDRVTTLELFFDLVFVFAFHQVSQIIVHEPTPRGVLQGMVTLAFVWWAWTSYAWLGNQARANAGLVQIAVVAALIIMFAVALAAPEAWHDLHGGLYGPLVFVVGYVLVRVLHAAVYVRAARGDRALRLAVLRSVGSGLTPAAVLLVVGALVGGTWQLALWVAAVVVDLVLVFLTSRAGSGWRLPAPAHFAERFALVVILVLGESVIAAGVLAARVPVTWSVLGVALLSVTLAFTLWWCYFRHLAARAEHEMSRRDDDARTMLAIHGYTYGHFVLVGGVIMTSVGIEEAMVHVPAGEPLGWFAAAMLGAGPSIYLLGTALFWWLLTRSWSLPRLAAGVLALALVPPLAVSVPAIGLALVTVLVVVLLGVEHRRRRA